MNSTMDNVQCTNDDGEIFRVGDRVQVVTCDDWDTGDGDILDGEGGVYTEPGDLYGKTGRVVRIGIPFAEVELENGEVLNFSGRCLQKADRRTFEEIVNELAENPCIKSSFSLSFREKEADLLEKETEDEAITIFDDGGVCTGIDVYTAAQLAAISAACTEIAANYAAAHGKEEA